jgi:hypothetical protein
MINHHIFKVFSILKYNLLGLHSRNGHELWWRLCQQTGKMMRLKQRSLNWINSMQEKKILFTNVFFSWSLCLLNMFPSMIFPICIFPVCWHNRHHSSWPFLECRPSKLYFKILNTLKIWWLIKVILQYISTSRSHSRAFYSIFLHLAVTVGHSTVYFYISQSQ